MVWMVNGRTLRKMASGCKGSLMVPARPNRLECGRARPKDRTADKATVLERRPHRQVLVGQGGCRTPRLGTRSFLASLDRRAATLKVGLIVKVYERNPRKRNARKDAKARQERQPHLDGRATKWGRIIAPTGKVCQSASYRSADYSPCRHCTGEGGVAKEKGTAHIVIHWKDTFPRGETVR